MSTTRDSTLSTLAHLSLVVLALLASGCAPPSAQVRPAEEPLLFPPPPDEARFEFERSVRGSGDLVQPDAKTRMRVLLTGETRSGTALAKPFDVAVCEGRIFVSDTVLRKVVVFDVSTPAYFEIGEQEPGMLRKPLGLATDAECNLYVADATTSRVIHYDQAGQYLGALGGTEWFERLSHVAVTADGSRVYTVDTGTVGGTSHRVRVFDTGTGEHLFDIGARGNEPGQFNLPRDADIGPDGRLYVVDGGNFRVQVFEPDGTFVRTFGALGRRYGQFARPKGIAVDNDSNVYVSDASHGNFQIFDAEGQLLLFVGSRSERPGRAVYMLPAGIDIDEDGRVYMVDQYFRKLDIYRPAKLQRSEGFVGAWP